MMRFYRLGIVFFIAIDLAQAGQELLVPPKFNAAERSSIEAAVANPFVPMTKSDIEQHAQSQTNSIPNAPVTDVKMIAATPAVLSRSLITFVTGELTDFSRALASKPETDSGKMTLPMAQVRLETAIQSLSMPRQTTLIAAFREMANIDVGNKDKLPAFEGKSNEALHPLGLHAKADLATVIADGFEQPRVVLRIYAVEARTDVVVGDRTVPVFQVRPVSGSLPFVDVFIGHQQEGRPEAFVNDAILTKTTERTAGNIFSGQVFTLSRTETDQNAKVTKIPVVTNREVTPGMLAQVNKEIQIAVGNLSPDQLKTSIKNSTLKHEAFHVAVDQVGKDLVSPGQHEAGAYLFQLNQSPEIAKVVLASIITHSVTQSDHLPTNYGTNLAISLLDKQLPEGCKLLRQDGETRVRNYQGYPTVFRLSNTEITAAAGRALQSWQDRNLPTTPVIP